MQHEQNLELFVHPAQVRTAQRAQLGLLHQALAGILQDLEKLRMTVNNGEFEKEKRRRSGSSLQQGLHTYQDAISTSQFLERSLKGLRVAKADSITVFAVLRSVMVDSIVPTNSFPVLTLFLLH